MSVNVEKKGDELIFRFDGRMDTQGSNLVEVQLDKIINEVEDFDPGAGKLIFDLKEVDFVSSAFMRVCIKYAKKVQQGNFILLNTDLNIKKTMKIAGLDKLFKIL